VAQFPSGTLSAKHKLAILEPLNYKIEVNNMKLIPYIVAFALLVGTSIAGVTVRVIPTPRTAEVDGSTELTVKRMPEGGVFSLTVNKGQDVSFYTIQWFKNGQLIPGETGQELRKDIATGDMNGVYNVTMASPCATVNSKPIQVVVERRGFQINTRIPTIQDGVAGLNDVEGAVYELQACQPNPVTDRATINFSTGANGHVMLKVVDLNGNVIATLVNDVLPAGTHEVTMNTRDYNMSSSMYYYVLSTAGFTDTKPMMMVK